MRTHFAEWRRNLNAPMTPEALRSLPVAIVMGVQISYLTRESLPLFASLLSVAVCGAFFSWFFVESIRRFERDRNLWHSLVWHRIWFVATVTSIVVVAFSYAAYVLAQQWTLSDTPFGVDKFLFVLMHTLFAIAFAIAPRVVREVYALREANVAKRNAEQLRVATLERSLAMSELKTLQAQIEPHFLYNVLANVQSMITHAPSTADAMLTHLIDYLKHALPSMRAGESTLRAELDLVRSYLSIAQLRFGNRLSVAVNDALDEHAAAFAMPPMLLLPLVENAIKHGAEGKPGPIRVDIDVKLDDNTLTICVSDDGPGFKQTSGSGIGIANVRERLAALYRDRASVNVVPREGGGVVSTLCIPVIEECAA